MKNKKSIIFSILAVSNVMFGSLLIQGMTNNVVASSTSNSIKVSKEINDNDFKYIKVTFKLGESEIGKVAIRVSADTDYIDYRQLESYFDHSKYTIDDDSSNDGYELKDNDSIVVHLKKIPPVDTTKKSLKVLNFRIVNAKPNESVSPLLFDFYDYEHEFQLPKELIPDGFRLDSTLYPNYDNDGYSIDIISEKDTAEPYPTDPVENIFKPVNIIFTSENGDKLNSTKFYVTKDSSFVSNDTIFGLLKYNSQLSEYEMIKDGNVDIKEDSITVPLRKLAPKDISVEFVDEDTLETIDTIFTKVKKSSRFISKEQLLGILNESKLTDYKLSQYNDFSISDNVAVIKLKKNTIIEPEPNPKPKPEQKYHTAINFIDQSTKEKITTLLLLGKHGQKYDLIIPEGYDLAENESKSVVIDKSKKNINIKLVKRPANVTVYSGNVTTHKLSKLYTKDGDVVNNRGLAANSDWHIDKKVIIKGETYYGVSTYEYVKASDIFEYTAINASVTTTNGKVKYLYDSKGKKISNRALAPNTSWRTDKSATINDKHAYRVSTNEWLFSNDTV